ncbi:leucine-rich repeat protein [Lysinibacillus sp. NPDC058147]|uniref:leucine-rich repeat protein n=1 Tax=unclassified Lysinibacillus TaxID=2636778 RepID=UPI0036D79FA1
MKKAFLLLVSTLLVFSQLSLGSLPVYATSNVEHDIVMPNDENKNEAFKNIEEAETSNIEDVNIAPGENEDEFITRNMFNGVVITGFNGSAKDIVIPSEINGQPVVMIDDKAFYNHQLTSVEIPSSVTTIGRHAFAENILTNVVIPVGVTTIGASAFFRNQLTSVVIPSSVTKIEEFAFTHNHLKHVEIPPKVTTIEASVFAYNQLTSVEISEGVTTIKGDAFTYNQLTSVKIPEGVTKIEAHAFDHNELTSVELPSSLTTIGYNAFSYNQLIDIKIPSNVKSIASSAFRYNQLRNVEIQLGVTTIGKFAFANNQIANVDIAPSVERIEQSAFEDNRLTELDLPSSVTMIEWAAFKNNQLTSVKLPSSIKTIEHTTFVNNKLTNIEIPSSVKTIGPHAFANNQLTSVEIPTSVTAIEYGAFYKNRLTSVELPTSLTKIDTYAFKDNQLTSVKIPSSITTIAYSLFENNQINSVEIPSSITMIAPYAFKNNRLTSVEIPSSVIEIGGDAFSFNEFDFVTFHGTPKLTNSSFESQLKREEKDKTFGGWFEDKDYTIEWTNSISQPMTIYAKWNTNYIVTFNSNGGSEVPSEKVLEGNLLQEPAKPVKGGYTFAGWYKNTEFKTAWDFAKDVVTENITLYAKWTKNNTSEGESGEVKPSYKVTFNSNGGSVVPSQEALEGETLLAPTIPAKKGYTFAGWYKDTGFASAWDFTKDVVTENITLYAKWTKDNTSEGESGESTPSYIVTYESNGGSEVPSKEVSKGELLQAPPTPVKEDHTFAGWYKDEELTTAWDFEHDVVTANEVLYAEWTKYNSSNGGSGQGSLSYIVTFNTNGGSEVPSQTVAYKASLQAPSNPVKEGYTFAGWYKDQELTTAWDFANDEVIENTTLFAKWTELSSGCNIIFNDISTNWAKEMIEEIANRCIIKGYPDGTFRPNDMIQRQHVVLMIDRALQLTPVRKAKPFTDVPTSHPYYEQITRLQRAGIVDGSNGAFRPNAYITRAQMAKILVLAFELTPGGNSSFKDVDPSHWASGYIATLADHNIALGDENGNFRPNENLTRAQFTAFMYRALGL